MKSDNLEPASVRCSHAVPLTSWCGPCEADFAPADPIEELAAVNPWPGILLLLAAFALGFLLGFAL